MATALPATGFARGRIAGLDRRLPAGAIRSLARGRATAAATRVSTDMAGHAIGAFVQTDTFHHIAANGQPGQYQHQTDSPSRITIHYGGTRSGKTYALILWNEQMDSSIAAGLASTRTYPLRSSFSPTYNMSANLISRFGHERARKSLGFSFAQFQADKAVVGLARQIAKNEVANIGQTFVDDHDQLSSFSSASTFAPPSLYRFTNSAVSASI